MPTRYGEFDFDHFEGFTPAATKFDVDGEIIFIPQSQISNASLKFLMSIDGKEHGANSIEVTEWWLTEKGLV